MCIRTQFQILSSLLLHLRFFQESYAIGASGAIGVLHTKQQNRKNDSQDLWIPINGLKKDIHCLQYAF